MTLCYGRLIDQIGTISHKSKESPVLQIISPKANLTPLGTLHLNNRKDL